MRYLFLSIFLTLFTSLGAYASPKLKCEDDKSLWKLYALPYGYHYVNISCSNTYNRPLYFTVSFNTKYHPSGAYTGMKVGDKKCIGKYDPNTKVTTCFYNQKTLAKTCNRDKCEVSFVLEPTGNPILEDIN